MADVEERAMKEDSSDSSSSSSEDELPAENTEKEKKKRREWKQKVLQMAILKYMLTDLNVASSNHGTKVPTTTYKEKLAEYMNLVDEYRQQKAPEDNDQQQSVTVSVHKEKDHDVSQESDGTKSVANLSEKRSQLQGRYSIKAQATELPTPTDVTEEELQELIEKYDLPPFPSRKKMGHSTVFSQIEEQEMMAYLHESSEMGLPRTRQQFQIDVRLYYLFKTEDEEDVKDYVFSKSWCKRFRKDNCPTFKFATQSQADKVQNKQIDSSTWQEEVKTKILNINENQLIPSADNIFLVECQSLYLDREEEEEQQQQTDVERYITLMVAYTASGEILRPLIVKNGKVSEQTKTKYADTFMFHSVDPPQVNQACLLIMKDEINRYAIKNELQCPTLVYLSPESCKAFGYMMWDFCKDNFMIVLPIPPSVYDILQSTKHGICTKLKDEWHVQKTLKHVSQDEEIAFLDSYMMLNKIWKSLRIKTKIMETFRDFKLKLVQHKPRTRKRKHDESSSQDMTGAQNYYPSTKSATDEVQNMLYPDDGTTQHNVFHAQHQPKQNATTQQLDTPFYPQHEPTQSTTSNQQQNFFINLVKEEMPTSKTGENQQITEIRCSNCDILLELNDDILHEIIVSNSGKFDEMILDKVKSHLDSLQGQSTSEGVQCEIIGKSSDWRDSWVKSEK